MISLGVVIVASAACGPGMRVGDLDEIQDAGVLRIVVRPGFGDWPSPRGLGGMDEKELLEKLAARLGVELEWVQAPRNDELLTWLRQGRGDLALGRFSVADLRVQEGIVASSTVDWLADELVSTQDGPVAAPDDLGGTTLNLLVSKSANLELDTLGEGPIEITPVSEEIPLERILERVASGRYGVTIADSGLVEVVRRMGRELRIVVRLSERRSLVWAIRADNPRLRRAVDAFLFAEKVLAEHREDAECNDLHEVRRRRILRLVTRNSPVTVTSARGGLVGFEFDLVSAFAKDLNLRLELEFPPPGTDPLEWLERGYGDIAALHEPAPFGGAGGVLVSVPYRHVDLIAVWRSKAPPVEYVEDLAGMSIAASRAVASWCRELPIMPAPEYETSPPELDALGALVELAKGQVDVAVVDQDTARLELAQRIDLEGGLVVLPGVPLTWAVGPDGGLLVERVDRFLSRARKSGLIKQLERKHFGNWRAYVPPYLPTVSPGALTPYDEILRWAGRENGIDWRLLASLMYEESRFDPDAVGPGGSAGLFQLMPMTWAELGVDDPHNPGEAVEAGSRYLKRLMGYFEESDLPDGVAMAIASYNVGPRHVFDARRLARKMNLDPEVWAGNVETAMLILDDPEVAREYPAGVCRCRRAVGYTRRILRRYGAYRTQVPPS